LANYQVNRGISESSDFRTPGRHTSPSVLSRGPHSLPPPQIEYTNANICPAAIRSMKHEHTNKNWKHVQKYLLKLNVARLTVFKNKPPKIC
jgi:hypothetical protein